MSAAKQNRADALDEYSKAVVDQERLRVRLKGVSLCGCGDSFCGECAGKRPVTEAEWQDIGEAAERVEMTRKAVLR